MEDSRKTILVVDDAPENIGVVKGLLSKEYKIKAALQGEKAIQIAEQGVDLILLDIRMPGMDGFEVCTRLKRNSNSSNIPIIFLSGEYEPTFEERALALGAAAFITKPVDPAQLLSAVNAVFQQGK